MANSVFLDDLDANGRVDLVVARDTDVALLLGVENAMFPEAPVQMGGGSSAELARGGRSERRWPG